jgi:hypothetical protein
MIQHSNTALRAQFQELLQAGLAEVNMKAEATLKEYENLLQRANVSIYFHDYLKSQ